MRPEIEPKRQTDPAEAPSRHRAAGGLALVPVTIVAMGAPAEPIERLIALQSGIARLADLLTRFRMPRFRLPRLAQAAGLLRHIF